MRMIAALFLAISLTGCSTAPSPINTFYDYQLATPQGEWISIHQLPSEIKNADVILIGEWHTHAGIHRFQTDLLKQLAEQGHAMTLSMEQFTRDAQPVLNEYLAGKIGEQYLIQQSNAWPNYESDYRPLVELAKSQQLPILAANAPKPIVRCIGQIGIEYIERLTPEQRQWLAAEINTQDSPYKRTFMASMHHGNPAQNENQYAAQVTWDETMAESIVTYLAAHPERQVLHIAGMFHTQQGLGTAASILRRNPELNVVIITPVGDVTHTSLDYQLQVLTPPVRYVQKAHQAAAIQALKNRNTDLICQ
ncbi:MAG: ChaN family lipoprotein [Shewanella sp.]|uniref:ChaN family lipoprotein n=1 Tax=Vibrio chanodichtyis TaxID=3027932 RepID=A0ABT5UZK7_9VIBR|nr:MULTISPECIES: ChaN family lipoprotein [Vibrio]MDE1514638.1 ChaN family lipoprotein [Vibrio chanodichtyis]